MDFERFGEGFGKIFYVRTPALSREAPRSVSISLVDWNSNPNTSEAQPSVDGKNIATKIQYTPRHHRPVPLGTIGPYP